MAVQYMPFLNEYGVYIVTALIGLLTARFFYNLLFGCHSGHDYRTPDQLAEVAEVTDEDEGNECGEMTSALPWDLEHVPFEFTRLPVEETIRRAQEFYNFMDTRRTVRFFSPDPIPADVIRNIIRAAGEQSEDPVVNAKGSRDLGARREEQREGAQEHGPGAETNAGGGRDLGARRKDLGEGAQDGPEAEANAEGGRDLGARREELGEGAQEHDPEAGANAEGGRDLGARREGLGEGAQNGPGAEANAEGGRDLGARREELREGAQEDGPEADVGGRDLVHASVQ